MTTEQEKSGIELIAEERQEQITKHGRTIQADIENNEAGQMIWMAQWLMQPGDFSDEAALNVATTECPYDWDEKIIFKMMKKPYTQRLIIAGAFIAAEIDRLQNSKP